MKKLMLLVLLISFNVNAEFTDRFGSKWNIETLKGIQLPDNVATSKDIQLLLQELNGGMGSGILPDNRIFRGSIGNAYGGSERFNNINNFLDTFSDYVIGTTMGSGTPMVVNIGGDMNTSNGNNRRLLNLIYRVTDTEISNLSLYTDDHFVRVICTEELQAEYDQQNQNQGQSQGQGQNQFSIAFSSDNKWYTELEGESERIGLICPFETFVVQSSHIVIGFSKLLWLDKEYVVLTKTPIVVEDHFVDVYDRILPYFQ